MADQHVSRRATGVLRWLGVLALLLGIAAMHVGVFSAATAGAHDMSTVAAHDLRTATTSDATELASQTVDHSLRGLLSASAMGSHPSPIHMQHACEVFTLATAAFALGLVLLGWFTRVSDADRLPGPGSRRTHPERAPPWTVPSLSQLSILRI
ncbi:DUF6153 family protein [Nocardia sp. NPDC059240]|uniref:DUF6153 family protein n=1 Tax=Nocardia sp. NPDC059240 TaxID=3346786 RepID=UPI0036CB445A